jgi:hypothetical protein
MWTNPKSGTPSIFGVAWKLMTGPTFGSYLGLIFGGSEVIGTHNKLNQLMIIEFFL